MSAHEAQVLPFGGKAGRDGLVRVGVTMLALVWREALRTGGPRAAEDVVVEHARTVAHSLLEAFGPRAAAYAEVLARALLEEIHR